MILAALNMFVETTAGGLERWDNVCDDTLQYQLTTSATENLKITLSPF